eukprot:1972137-Alexandrium_andersonii.AAC.1
MCIRDRSHRDHATYKCLFNCPYGPAISKLDLAAEKLKLFHGVKGGHRHDFAELRKLREKFSGTGKGIRMRSLERALASGSGEE